MQIDRIDSAILQRLAIRCACASVSQIASADVGLSQSACTRRIQSLEAAGLIEGYGARLGHKRLGFHVTALVDITLGTQIEEDLAQFEAAVGHDRRRSSIAHSFPGGQDYRLRIVCRDLDDYERLHREHLGRLPGVVTINSAVSCFAIDSHQAARPKHLFGASK